MGYSYKHKECKDSKEKMPKLMTDAPNVDGYFTDYEDDFISMPKQSRSFGNQDIQEKIHRVKEQNEQLNVEESHLQDVPLLEILDTTGPFGFEVLSEDERGLLSEADLNNYLELEKQYEEEWWLQKQEHKINLLGEDAYSTRYPDMSSKYFNGNQ